jgi:hypothetical protein
VRLVEIQFVPCYESDREERGEVLVGTLLEVGNVVLCAEVKDTTEDGESGPRTCVCGEKAYFANR